MEDWKHWYPNKMHKVNYVKAVEFNYPSWIPCEISIFPAVRIKYGEALEDIILKYPFIFGKYKKGVVKLMKLPKYHRPDTYNRDNWDCLWYTSKGGYEGQVVEHPLENWSNFNTYSPPDPKKYSERGRNHWFLARLGFWVARRKGMLIPGTGERLFDRLYFLRGFKNLMIDIATDSPKITELVNMLTEHELKLIKLWLKLNVDIIYFHTDIGTQSRLMIPPAKFRKHIKPMFTKLFQTCRKEGVIVYLSSDGNLLEIVDDLIESGVSIHDPQVRACTLEGIKKHYKGKMCIDLDLDRQLFPFATPAQIKKHIKESVELLNTSEGGFMMKAEFSDTNIPLENIEATCEAFMEFCFPRA
ncbi:MAG: hypothetical protein GF364_05340 [Candidatus Lokiarchaeota archaeon]|nr:hypothetical protein [Candidatus Lokiarchaeota archaeon]